MFCCAKKWSKVCLFFFSFLMIIAGGISIYLTSRLRLYNIWNLSGDESMSRFDVDAN